MSNVMEQEDQVPFVDSDGSVFHVDRVKADGMVARGYKPADPDYVKFKQEQAAWRKDDERTRAAFAYGVGKGIPFGELAMNGLGMGQQLRDHEKYLPNQTSAGEVAGLVGSALASGGEGLVAKTLGGGFKVATAPGRLLAGGIGGGIARRVVQEATDGAVLAAVYGAGDQMTENGTINPEMLAEGVMSGALSGAAFGTFLGVGEKAIGGGIRRGMERAKLRMNAIDEGAKTGSFERSLYGGMVDLAAKVSEADASVLKDGGVFDPFRKAGEGADDVVRGLKLNKIGKSADAADEAFELLGGARADEIARDAKKLQIDYIAGSGNVEKYTPAIAAVDDVRIKLDERIKQLTDDIADAEKAVDPEATAAVDVQAKRARLGALKTLKKDYFQDGAVGDYFLKNWGSDLVGKAKKVGGKWKASTKVRNNLGSRARGKGIRAETGPEMSSWNQMDYAIDDISKEFAALGLADEVIDLQNAKKAMQDVSAELDDMRTILHLDDEFKVKVANPQQEGNLAAAKLAGALQTPVWMLGGPFAGAAFTGAAALASVPTRLSRMGAWMARRAGQADSGLTSITRKARKVSGLNPILNYNRPPLYTSVIPFQGNKSGEPKRRMARNYKQLMSAYGEEERMMAEVADQVGRDPEFAGTVVATTMTMVKARDLALKRAKMHANGRQSPDMEIWEFNETIEGLRDPWKMIKGVEDGSLSAPKIRAIRDVYPGIYENMKTEVMSEMRRLHDVGKTVPAQTKTRLSIAFGHDFDGRINKQYSTEMQSFYGGTERGMPQKQQFNTPQIASTFENTSEVITTNERR